MPYKILLLPMINEKCDSLMQRYNELRTVQSIMAKRLGDRVVLR